MSAVLNKKPKKVPVHLHKYDILHKSDAGGVKVGLKSADEVKAAINAMTESPQIKGARIDGYLIEEMAPAGQEIVVGAVRDGSAEAGILPIERDTARKGYAIIREDLQAYWLYHPELQVPDEYRRSSCAFSHVIQRSIPLK